MGLAEVFARGTVSPGRVGRGPRFRFSVPIIETEPSAFLASFTSIDLKLGSVDRFLEEPGKANFSLYLPKHCTPGQMRFEAEASFANVAGLPVHSANASYRAPCPREPKRHR